MYAITHSTQTNAGDFLIHERCRALIERWARPDLIEVINGRMPLDDVLDVVNSSKVLVLCGGPAYRRDFYPGCIPLVQPLDRIEVPIAPMAIGLGSGVPADELESFTLDQPSHDALRLIHDRIDHSSVRDVLTERVLRRHGIENVVTTGCAAWYHPEHTEKDFTAPQQVAHVAVSAPGLGHFRQAAGLVKLVRRKFPKARRTIMFHQRFRQIVSPRKSGLRQHNLKLAAYAKLHGYRVINASGSTHKLDEYGKCDLHVGYRVHAHLDALSRRTPSLLLQEDTRGVGQSLTLGTDDVNARDADALDQVSERLDAYLRSNFEPFHAVVETMKQKHATMVRFLKTLPGAPSD